MAASITVHAAPGRLYPHPAGHTITGARFIGRGFDRNAGPDADMDARWPILAKGESVPDDSDMYRAVANGDLLLTPYLAPTVEAPAAPPELSPRSLAPGEMLTEGDIPTASTIVASTPITAPTSNE